MPNDPRYMEQLKLLPLTYASTFCQIATRIQDRLVESPLLPLSETATYDAQILDWFEELPSVLSNHKEHCPEFLHRARLIMKWRFHNIRIVLHRPVLLTTALRRCTWADLSAEEKVAVGKCRSVACITIEEISRDCMPDLISGWNAVWLCFQACMVPLVSLFSDASVPAEVESWQSSIETALDFFSRVADWSIAAKRSGDAVSRIYTAYKAHAASLPQHALAPALRTTPQHGFSMQNAYSHLPVGSQLSLDPDAIPFDYNASVPRWPSVDTNDPNFLNYFWDNMMWDKNLPDVNGAPHGSGNEYDFAGSAQDAGAGGAYWTHGN
jgi:hypothetical protein